MQVDSFTLFNTKAQEETGRHVDAWTELSTPPSKPLAGLP